MTKNAKQVCLVKYPETDFSDNFEFDTVHPDGVFNFHFRYFGGKWHGWCTLPSGEIRAFGVLPFVLSWTGFSDYGLYFDTSLQSISRSDLANTSLYIVSWG